MNKTAWYRFDARPIRAMVGRLADRLGRKPTHDDAANQMAHTLNVWEEYERRKAHIVGTSETTEEQDRRIRELIDELGI